MAEILKKQV